MSFSPEIFNKKLSGLSDTQDSIVTISQWILFHHRHCKESARLWADYVLRLDASPSTSSKKLSLLYLCNDVVQQARHKRKTEFIRSYGEVLPEVLNRVYGGVTDAIKPKVTRLIDVWEQRSVFSPQEIKQLRRAIELSKQQRTVGDGDSADAAAAAAATASAVAVASELTQLNQTLTHLNRLSDANQGNLQQIAIQAKAYLPTDPAQSDNLPSPRIYLSKLGVLERLCQLATANITAIKRERASALAQVRALEQIVESGAQTDEGKLQIVAATMERLAGTKQDLEEMVGPEGEPEEPSPEVEEPSPAIEEPSPAVEEPSPAVEPASDDDAVPGYEASDSDSDAPPAKRAKTSRSPSVSSGASTPSSKKTVAFSEDVEIKEYEREEETDLIRVARSDDDGDEEDYDPAPEPSREFEMHHKDDLELKHEHEAAEYDPGEYDPAEPDVQNDVLSILSKLA
ncbi:CID domain-containing protein [[Candida] zeylanoides]